MTDTKPAEPSMEEILASIRQIINQNDGDAPADASALSAPAMVADASAVDDAPEDEEVLELTSILEEPAMAEPAAEPISEPVAMEDAFTEISQNVEPEPVAKPVQAAAPVSSSAQELITGMTAAAATAALNNLAATLQNERAEHSLPMGNGARTLESMVVEAIKPLLKDWLDTNLTGIVERVVTQEVEKLTRRLGG